MTTLSLDHQFEPLAVALDHKQIYLNKYDGEWFVVPDDCVPLIEKLKGGLALSDLPDLTVRQVEIVSELATSGILSETRKSPVMHGLPAHRMKVTLVIIEGSSFCNLACTYCFEDAPTRGEKMTIATADDIVASIEKLDLADSFVLEFNGGESFINFPVMKHIVERVGASQTLSRHNITLGVTTNLTLLSQAMIDFLKEHRFSVSVSFDGTQEDHDRHRVFANGRGSHAQILKNFERLRADGVGFSTLSVISEPGQLTRSYQFLKEQKIPFVSFAIRRHSDRLPLTTVDYEEISNELVEAFLDSFESFKARKFAPQVRDVFVMIRNLLSPQSSDYMCLRTPCGAGLNMITYDTFGDIYACQDLIKEPQFKICGASDPDPQQRVENNDVVQKLRARRPGGNRGCETCEFQMFCQGGCYSTSYFASGKQLQDSFSTKTPHCEYYYASFSKLIQILGREQTKIINFLDSRPFPAD